MKNDDTQIPEMMKAVMKKVTHMFCSKRSLIYRNIPPEWSKMSADSLISRKIHHMAETAAAALKSTVHRAESRLIRMTRFADSAKSVPKKLTLYSRLLLRYESSK